MVWNYGPERAEAIRVLQEQIRRAKMRLEAIGATADAEEASYDVRDAADVAYGALISGLASMVSSSTMRMINGPITEWTLRLLDTASTRQSATMGIPEMLAR